MATKNVTRAIFNINSAQIGGWWVKDDTNSGLLSGVLYVSPAYFKENRGSFVIRGSHGSQKAVEKLDGATFGDITLAKGSRDGDLQAFILTSPNDGHAEGIFQIDALFTESDGQGEVAISSDDITDATATGRNVLTTKDAAALKALLALKASDITDSTVYGQILMKMQDENAFRARIGTLTADKIAAGTDGASLFVSPATLKAGLTSATWFADLVKSIMAAK